MAKAPCGARHLPPDAGHRPGPCRSVLRPGRCGPGVRLRPHRRTSAYPAPFQTPDVPPPTACPDLLRGPRRNQRMSEHVIAAPAREAFTEAVTVSAVAEPELSRAADDQLGLEHFLAGGLLPLVDQPQQFADGPGSD